MKGRETTPAATERVLVAAEIDAERAGDTEEAARIKGTREGLTGLRLRGRQRKTDPIDRITNDTRLRQAAQQLRIAAERITGADPAILAPPEVPKDPVQSYFDRLPSLKNPPAVPDPINRWNKAPRTTRRGENGEDVKADCPPTWPPKPVKDTRGAPKQRIAEAIFSAIRDKRSGDRNRGIWRAALDPFATIELKAAIFGVIVERRSLRWACLECGLSTNGRHMGVLKRHVVIALKEAAQHLDDRD